MAVDPATLKVACRLLEQLCLHPHRADTSDGIARWWLAEDVEPALLERALNWLKDEALMEDRPAADGRVRWRRRAGLAELTQRLHAWRVRTDGAPPCPC
jgi:hypothetical protein